MSDFRYTPRAVSIIRRHARTMAPATIATIMRCPIGTIELICQRHGIEIRDNDILLRDPERKVVKKELEIQIGDVLLRVVSKEARRRGVDTHTLIERLIEKIAEDGLFGAVLDR